MNTPFFWPALFAILTVIVSGWMMLYKPRVPARMLPFEFARTAADVKILLIRPGSAEPLWDVISKLRYLNQVDFLYIFCYTAFGVTFAWQAHEQTPALWSSLVALYLAPLPGVFDVLEDVQLLRILAAVKQKIDTNYEPELTRLSIFTWIKWVSLGWLTVPLLPYFWHDTYPIRAPGLVLAVLTVVVATTGIMALVKRLSRPKPGIFVPTAFVNPLFLLSFLLVVYTIYEYVLHR